MNTAYAKQLGALLLFGMNGIVASHIALSSYEIVLSRTLTGFLFLLLLSLPQKRKLAFLKNKKTLALVLASGAAMGCSWMFLYEAYAQAGVSVATLLYYCGPVLVLAFAPAVLHEKLSPARACGVAAALLGMVLLNLDKVMLHGFSWGLACGLLSALLYAVMILFNKKAQGITGYESALLQLFAAFCVTALFTCMRRPGPVSLDMGSLSAILLLGVVNTGIGCYLYFSSLQKLSAQAVSLCGYLEPLSALVFSALFLGERLTALQLCGAAMILGGALAGEGFARRKANR